MRKYIFEKDLKVNLSKRVWAWLCDFILLVILGCIFSSLTISINKNLECYKTATATVNSQIELMNNMIFDAGLSSKDEEGNILSQDDMFRKYAIGHILLSYDNNKEFFEENGYTNLHQNEKIKGKYESISPQKDCLSYLYIFYFPSLEGNYNQSSYGGLTGNEYFKFVLNSVNKDLSMFDMDKEYPILKPIASVNLYSFIVEENKDNNIGITYKNTLADIFVKTYEHNVSLFQKLTFFEKEYNIYSENYHSLVVQVNVDHVISYSFAFLIVYILIPLILRNDITIGRKLNKFVVGSNDEKQIKWYQFIIRKIGDYFFNFSAIFLIAFFMTGTNSLMMPLILSGNNFNINQYLFISIFTFLGIVNALVLYLKKADSSLIDIISGTSTYLEHRE